MPTRFSDLESMFIVQDRVVQANRKAGSAEFDLIEQWLVLGFDIQLGFHDQPIAGMRQAKPAAAVTTETIRINLLHTSWSSLVNGTRLALHGAYVDAFTLARGVLEAAYHAEYFRDHPNNAEEWDTAGQLIDLDARRMRVQEFERKYRVRRTVQQKYGTDTSLHRFYHELSTYGSHTNPFTVAFRISSAIPGQGNLGFVAVGYSEAPRLCASHLLHIARYALSEYYDGVYDYIKLLPDILEKYDALTRIHDELRANSPGGLSLLK